MLFCSYAVATSSVQCVDSGAIESETYDGTIVGFQVFMTVEAVKHWKVDLPQLANAQAATQ